MFGKKHSAETKALFSKQRTGSKGAIGNKNNLGKIKKYKNSSSKFFGVCLVYKYKEKKKWTARICINGKDKKLGNFDIEEDAAKRFDAECWKIFHDLEKLNFPENYHLS